MKSGDSFRRRHGARRDLHRTGRLAHQKRSHVSPFFFKPFFKAGWSDAMLKNHHPRIGGQDEGGDPEKSGNKTHK